MLLKDLSVPIQLSNLNMSSIRINPKLVRRTVLLLLCVTIFLTAIAWFNKTSDSSNYKDMSTANFRFDINKLTAAARIIESLRADRGYPDIPVYGTEGKVLGGNEINEGLRKALVKLADSDNDGMVSDTEISGLEIMHLKPELYTKELRELKFNFSSNDANLNNYVIITHGKQAGTVLYNGPLRFTDSKGRRFFGLELFMEGTVIKK